jgi:hypothetical protein
MRKNILLEQAHAILASLITQDDIIVDATMGNGHDTLFLSTIAKEVYAFDIQQDAINKTKEKVGHLSHVHLIHDSHLHMFDYVKEFKGNPSITTDADTTLQTLRLILPKLNKNGFIQIICYPGHPEGKIESEKLQAWKQELPIHHYQIIESHFVAEIHEPPYMLMIYKTKDESD